MVHGSMDVNSWNYTMTKSSNKVQTFVKKSKPPGFGELNCDVKYEKYPQLKKIIQL